LKILILKPSSLGDVIQALPVLRLLKLHDPGHEIYWWIDSSLRALVDDDPDLSGVIPFERKLWASPLHWGGLGASIQGLRKKRFDLVIDLQGLARSGAFAWLANGAFTVGLDDFRELACGFYDVAIPRPHGRPHAVDWYLEVVRYLGVPLDRKFVWMREHPSARQALEDRWRPSSRKWVVLVPGARWTNKRWPAAHFAQLAKRILEGDRDCGFVVLGGKEDLAAGNEICAAIGDHCLNLAGETSLVEMVEWIRLSAFVISNDTGPMHIAAALQKPVWALFGPTDPRKTGPYGQIGRAITVDLPCRPCMKSECRFERPLECLRELEPEMVACRLWKELGT
jgi:heptosyltransferase-1